MATFKFCTNCDTRAPRLARKCSYCGGKAIWRKPTCEEIAADKARADRAEELLQNLLKNGALYAA